MDPGASHMLEKHSGVQVDFSKTVGECVTQNSINKGLTVLGVPHAYNFSTQVSEAAGPLWSVCAIETLSQKMNQFRRGGAKRG